MLVQLSDPHIGYGPPADAERLAAAVAAILALRQRPDAVLVTGDVAEHGRAEDYARARELLAALPMPVHVLPGNHDDRAALRAAFDLPGEGADPIRYAVRCGDLRLVVCDTTVPGQDDGRLDVPWLRERLADDPQTPTIVAMHHPPVAVGLRAIDRVGMDGADRTALAAALAGAPQVRRIVAGHVHRSAVATVGAVPVLALGGTASQLRLDFEADAFDPLFEPPLIAVHALVDGVLVSHLQPV